MEQSQSLFDPTISAETQDLKNNNTAKIIAGIASAVAVVGIAFSIYGIIQIQAKDQQISDLQRQIEDNKTGVSSNEVDNENTPESNLTENNSPSSSYSYRYGDNATVSFVLPQNWGYIETQNKEGSCATKGCVDLILAPDAYLEQAAKYNGFYVLMRLRGQYDGNPSLVAGVTNYDGTPKSLVEAYTGLYTDQMTDSGEPVNGHPAYYRKVANDSYVDINFAIQNSKNDILVVNSRIESWSYNYPEHEVTGHEDYKAYEQDVEQIIKSIKFSQ